MLQDIKNTDGLRELLFFMFSNPSKIYKHKLNNDLQQSHAANDTGKRIVTFMLMIITVLLLLNQFTYAQKPVDQYFLPGIKDGNLLFFLQCDSDANTLVYELNYNNAGKLHPDSPIKVSWIKYGQDYKFRELTSIERKFAYGIKTKPIGNEEYEIRLVAYRKLPLYLKKSEVDNKYHMYIMDEGKNLLLKRVFVRINRGTFRFPKVHYIDLITTNSATGLEILKRIRT